MLTNFSPNMIKTYIDCPKKYYFRYIENVNVPQSVTPFEKGKKIHALANYYLQKIKIDRIETALNDREKAAWELLKSNPFYNMDYLKSEFSLMIRLSEGKQNFRVGGRLDAVVHKEKDLYILDYKTGSTPKNPEYDFQTMIYLLCAKRYFKDFKTISFVYINLKDKNNYVIKLTDELEKKYEKLVAKECETILSDKLYSCKISDNCKRCEFYKICPHDEK